MTTCCNVFDMFLLTCLSCDSGRGTFFTPFFVFKLHFDHVILTCHDMFDMFSLTCLACNMGRGTLSAYFLFVFKPDVDHGWGLGGVGGGGCTAQWRGL